MAIKLFMFYMFYICKWLDVNFNITLDHIYLWFINRLKLKVWVVEMFKWINLSIEKTIYWILILSARWSGTVTKIQNVYMRNALITKRLHQWVLYELLNVHRFKCEKWLPFEWENKWSFNSGIQMHLFYDTILFDSRLHIAKSNSI